MRDNHYDNEVFFEKYSRFQRSVKGLDAAGEWHEFKRMLPDFKGKRVLDIGCGYGWHCIYAAEQGADYVLGTDISEKMLKVAKEKTAFENVEYGLSAMEDLDLPQNSFDVVISSLAFHYTADFKEVCRQVNRCLTKGGAFVFSVEHPIFTAQGKQDWVYDEEGKPAHWPVDNYFSEGKRNALFLGEYITKYHRTLTTYVSSLGETGFFIKEIVEPKPPKAMLDTVEGIANELRRPMMLIVSSIKA